MKDHPKIILCDHQWPFFEYGVLRLLDSYDTSLCRASETESSRRHAGSADLFIRCSYSTHTAPSFLHCQPAQPDVPVLFISYGWVETEAVVNQAGLRGYLGPGCLPEHLLNAVKVILQGGSYYHPGLHNLPPVGPLTPRHLQVLELVGHGLTDGEISNRLGVSVATVRHHLESLCQKLRIERRGELTALAVLGGLSNQRVQSGVSPVKP